MKRSTRWAVTMVPCVLVEIPIAALVGTPLGLPLMLAGMAGSLFCLWHALDSLNEEYWRASWQTKTLSALQTTNTALQRFGDSVQQAGVASAGAASALYEYGEALRNLANPDAVVEARKYYRQFLHFIPYHSGISIDNRVVFCGDLRPSLASWNLVSAPFGGLSNNGIAHVLVQRGLLTEDEADSERDCFFAYFSTQARGREFVEELAYLTATGLEQ